MRITRAILVLQALLFFLAPAAFAQEGLPGIENSLLLVATPQDPSPGQTVHIELSSLLLDLEQSSIFWTAGGVAIPGSRDKTSVDVVAPAYGSRTSVSVSVPFGESSEASASIVIAPSKMDLLYEADSYTPPFYLGRALPSAGSQLRLQALPHFLRSNGSAVPASSIVFTWKRDGVVLGSVSGLGKSEATIRGPELFGTDKISVDAKTSDGAYSASAQIIVPSVEPSLMLYEDSPLFGIMYHKALGTQSFVQENEMTFAAVPLFAAARAADDTSLIYDWTVNSSKVPADDNKRSEMTIDASKAPGSALIELEVTHVSNLFLDARRSWNVTFSGGTSQSGANPFFQSQ